MENFDMLTGTWERILNTKVSMLRKIGATEAQRATRCKRRVLQKKAG